MRALDLFEAFRKAGRQLSLSELARACGIPVSTCHGTMRALERRGFLYFPTKREAYPTRKLWDLATNLAANDPIAARLGPTLAELRDATGETVILGTRHGDEVLYLMVLESPQTVRYTAGTGDRKPLHSSSIGKVMLGAMPDAELDAWLASHGLPRVTDRTLTSVRRLRADIQASRARGYYATRGENVADVTAFACPLQFTGTTLGVAVAGPLQRIEGAEARVAAKLRQCVQSAEMRNDGER